MVMVRDHPGSTRKNQKFTKVAYWNDRAYWFAPRQPPFPEEDQSTGALIGFRCAMGKGSPKGNKRKTGQLLQKQKKDRKDNPSLFEYFSKPPYREGLLFIPAEGMNSIFLQLQIEALYSILPAIPFRTDGFRKLKTR